jgi:hypothetical protein
MEQKIPVGIAAEVNAPGMVDLCQEFFSFSSRNWQLAFLAMKSKRSERTSSLKRIGFLFSSSTFRPKLTGPSNWPRMDGYLDKSMDKNR